MCHNFIKDGIDQSHKLSFNTRLLAYKSFQKIKRIQQKSKIFLGIIGQDFAFNLQHLLLYVNKLITLNLFLFPYV